MIIDFGTADAGTSMPLMNAVVAQVRAAEGQATPIVIGYEDQTNNDWNSVFRRVHGLLPSPVKSYMQDETNVFALAAGTCSLFSSPDGVFHASEVKWNHISASLKDSKRKMLQIMSSLQMSLY